MINVPTVHLEKSNVATHGLCCRFARRDQGSSPGRWLSAAERTVEGPARACLSARLADQRLRLLYQQAFGRPSEGRHFARESPARRRVARGRGILRRGRTRGARLGGIRDEGG